MKGNKKVLSDYLNSFMRNAANKLKNQNYISNKRIILLICVAAVAILITYGMVISKNNIIYAVEKKYNTLNIHPETFKMATRFTKAYVFGEMQVFQKEENIAIEPEIEVPVDMEAEENEQKSVDAGHSPWKLDPAFVTQVFVSLKISPEGIIGDYPVDYTDFKVVKNTGSYAEIEVTNDKSPVSRVYLKRLIRQGSNGIWTVVGYDPAH